MPVGVEARFQQILDEVVTFSQQIRSSALVHANSQNLHLFEKLRRRLETIRVSADTILEAIVTASLSDYVIHDQIIDWLISGEPRACLGKLKEMDDKLKPIVQEPLHTRPPRRTEDKISAVTVFLDKHADLFDFLLNPHMWNYETLLPQTSEAPQVDTIPTTESIWYDPQGIQQARSSTTTTEYDYGRSPLLTRGLELTWEDIARSPNGLRSAELEIKNEIRAKLNEKANGRYISEAGVRSPSADSTDTRTPTSRRTYKRSWTLFVRLQAPANETEVRDFFGGEQSGIVRVTYPHTLQGRSHKIAYVEFGDEESMTGGLEKNNKKINGSPAEVTIATSKEDRAATRGGPRGRGGRGSGSVARGFAAAGLTGKGRGNDI